MINRRLFTLGAVSTPVAARARKQSSFPGSIEFKWDEVELYDVEPRLIPFGATKDFKVRTDDDIDEEGVRLNLRAGEYHDNPVTQSQYGMMLLSAYREHGWAENLEAALANGRRIHKNSEIIDGRAYFPYGFRMPLFGRQDMVLDPPWYSGMAQGQVLQFYSQLFEITGDVFWQKAASGVFESFREVMNKDLPWWPNVDERANLWFEEYPFDPEQHVFNGHVFAIAGVYEYWRATGDEWAEQLTKGAIRTILDRKDDFRVEGHQSRYALGQPIQHDTYHTVHINQLMFLHGITHDDRFAQTADDFADDWDIFSTVGELHLEPGAYNTPKPVNAGSLLVMDEDETTTFEQAVTLNVLARRTENERKRVFYNVKLDDAEPFWLEETESSLLRGMYTGSLLNAGSTIGTLQQFSPERPLSIMPGEYKAYPEDHADFSKDPENLEIQDIVDVKLAKRVLISAQPYVLVSSEELGSYWIEWGKHLEPIDAN